MTRLVMKRAIDGVTDGDTRWAMRAGYDPQERREETGHDAEARVEDGRGRQVALVSQRWRCGNGSAAMQNRKAKLMATRRPSASTM